MNRRLFFVAALLVISPSVTAAQLRLGRDVVPLSQGIALRLDPRLERYAGVTTIRLDVRKNAPSFSVHAEGMNIESVAIDGVAATFAAGPEQTLVITPAAPLAAGQATLRISFDNDYDRTAVGLYKMTSGDEPYVFTQFQAIDARKAFPCFDEPSFKIPYQLTTIVPAQYDALFNTPVEKESADGAWKTIRFAATRPLPSYLLAMAVGTFEYTDVAGASVPMRIITTRGKGALTGVAAQSTPKLLAALETYFGSRYPFEKLDLIAVPEYWPGAMENPGLITFSEEILLLDPKAATPAQRRTNARITAHELAHMWFGDLVTMAWWDDLWLNESFGDWMGDRITQQVFPELGVEMNELQNVQNIMNVDASPLTNPIRDRNATPGSALSNVGIAYNKGKAVIRMFERWLGPERFQAGIRRHLQRHAWSNATASDFWSSLGTEVATPMETFIDQAGVPLVQVEIVPPNRVRLTQSRYLRHGVTAPAQRWIVPVALRYSDGKSLRTQTVLLDAAAKTFTLDAKKVAWVFPHADAAGYYRWRVPSAAFVTLASHATSSLSAGERIAFLGNVNALLDAGAMRGNEFLDVLARFSAEEEPEVIRALLAGVGRAGEVLTEEEQAALLAPYVARTFGPALERIGYTRRDGESPAVTTLRSNLLAWVANVGREPNAVAFMREQAARYLQDAASVDASIAGVVLSFHAINSGSAELFEEYRKRFEAATVPAERTRLLNALGAFRDAATREKALAYSLSPAVRPTEMSNIVFGAMSTEGGRAAVYEWMTRNYDTIVNRLPEAYWSLIPRLAGGCDEARLARAREFFNVEGRLREGMKRELERVDEQVRGCVALRAREAAPVREFLARSR